MGISFRWSKAPIVSLSKKLPLMLSTGWFRRNGFECDFTIKLRGDK